MSDFAIVSLQGRAVADAKIFNIDSPDKTAKATFSLAVNLRIRKRDGEEIKKTIYRNVVAWGGKAKYIHACQEADGLKGRLITVAGSMDTEFFEKDDTKVARDVIRVEEITVMDRRHEAIN